MSTDLTENQNDPTAMEGLQELFYDFQKTYNSLHVFVTTLTLPECGDSVLFLERKIWRQENWQKTPKNRQFIVAIT